MASQAADTSVPLGPAIGGHVSCPPQLLFLGEDGVPEKVYPEQVMASRHRVAPGNGLP